MESKANNLASTFQLPATCLPSSDEVHINAYLIPPPPPFLLTLPKNQVNQQDLELKSKSRSSFTTIEEEMLRKHPPIESKDPSVVSNKVYTPEELAHQDRSLFSSCPECNFLIKHLQLQAHIKLHATPIGNGLYLGSGINSSNLRQLKRLKIGAILNCANEVPNTFSKQEDFIYKRLSLTDTPGQSIRPEFEQCLQFIHQSIKQQRPILVHCALGKSRSATIVIAYLMNFQKMNLRQAYEYVKSKRQIIAPNPSYAKQLIQYQLQMYGNNSIDISEIKVQGVPQRKT